MEQTVYAEGMDLASLPYFEKRDGRLVLSDDSVGPVIDVHTHLALAFVFPMRVDLHSGDEPTEHYLSMHGRRIDFEVYLNRNFTPEDLGRMKRDLVLKGLTGSGMRRTHTIPNLLREMEELGISQSVLLPIDLPVLSSNAINTLKVLKGNGAFILFGSVHPYASDVEGKLDEQLALGARGIKVHPATQMVRPDNPRAMRLYHLCAERNLPVMFHCGPVGIEPKAGRKRSQVILYEKALKENPKAIFILGHSGALQMEQALEYSKQYPNAYLDLSCQSLSNVRKILREADKDRLMYGTDWPFYHQSIALAKILLATEGDPSLRRQVLYGNAARLFGIRAAS